MLKVATPSVRLPIPSAPLAEVKVTTPVGVPAPGGATVTVAMKVTDWPVSDGFGALVGAVVVAALTVVKIAAVCPAWRTPL